MAVALLGKSFSFWRALWRLERGGLGVREVEILGL